MKRCFLVFLFLFSFSLAFAQDEPQPQPAPRPVGVKITRPGVVSIAGTPPVGGTLVVYGYSMDEPVAGSRLQGVTGLYEYTVVKRVSIFVTTTAPLVRDGNFAFGDTCPGVKFRLTEEGRRFPMLAVSYALKVPTAGTGFGIDHSRSQTELARRQRHRANPMDGQLRLRFGPNRRTAAASVSTCRR